MNLFKAALAQLFPGTNTPAGEISVQDLLKGFLASAGSTAVLVESFRAALEHVNGRNLPPQTWAATFVVWFAVTLLKLYYSSPEAAQAFDVPALKEAAAVLRSYDESIQAAAIEHAVLKLERPR